MREHMQFPTTNIFEFLQDNENSQSIFLNILLSVLILYFSDLLVSE